MSAVSTRSLRTASSQFHGRIISENGLNLAASFKTALTTLEIRAEKSWSKIVNLATAMVPETAGSGVGARSPVSSYQLGRMKQQGAGLYCRGRLLGALLVLTVAEARAESCPQPTDEIATDRPDVTNSSLVVPVGSFQSENGVNLSSRDGGRTVDGTNTRWRLGIAPCLEVLVDLPTYFANVKAPGSSGFSDVAPAVKWQISPLPGQLDLSMSAGAALPTGRAEITARGIRPYLQFPWSWELYGGWGLSGMFTEFFQPADFTNKLIAETTFVIEKKLTEKVSLFTEYVGDYPQGGSPNQFLNSGGLYHPTPTQQLDFHFAVGLNHNAPRYIVGIGYSFRVDGLFAATK